LKLVFFIFFTLFSSSNFQANENGLCPVVPYDSKMFSDLMELTRLASGQCFIRATNTTKENCIPGAYHCKCSADYRYEKEVLFQNTIHGIRIPDFCHKRYKSLCEESFNGERKFKETGHLFDKNDYQGIVSHSRERLNNILTQRELWKELFYDTEDDLENKGKDSQGKFCKMKERGPGEVSGNVFLGYLTDDLSCAFEGRISPSQVPCKNLQSPEICKNKKNIYHTDSLCVPSVYLSSGKFKLSVFGDIHNKKKRHVKCMLIYRAHMALNTSDGPSDMDCGNENQTRYKAMNGPTSKFDQLWHMSDLGYPYSVLYKACYRLERQLKDIPSVSRPYFIEQGHSQYWQWAQLNTLKNYTEEGWERFVKIETQECETEVINGQRVTRTPSKEQDQIAQNYFDNEIKTQLKKLSNPKHTLVCCKR